MGNCCANTCVWISPGRAFLKNEIGVGAIRARPEIEHDRTICGFTAGDGAVDCSPRSVLAVPGPVRPVVSGFHADDEVGVFLDGFGAAIDVHLVHGLFEPTAHTIGNDIEEGQDADFGVVHHAFFFLKEGFGAGSACVDDGGDSGSEDEIGGDGVGLGCGSALRDQTN